MMLRDRLVALLPLLLSMAAAVLSALCLFAGHKKGYMEDYAIVRVNTSAIGLNYFHNTTTYNSSSNDPGILGDIEGALQSALHHLEDDLNHLGGELANKLASTLGVSEWYSIHLMDICEGNFEPDATAHNPDLNTTRCSSSGTHNRLNLTRLLDHELSVGPFNLNLADINWPDDIQTEIDQINNTLYGMYIVYIIGIVFSILTFIGSVVGMVIIGHRSITLFNFTLALFAAILLLVSSILVTVNMKNAVHNTNKSGQDVGISLAPGNKYLGLTWGAAASMIVAAAIWSVEFCVACRQKRKVKKAAKSSY